MDEKNLIKVIKPYLENCRSGDWKHALRVVKWVKVLGENREDLDLLITAAYIHDIGWTNVLPKGKVNFQEMLTYEVKANENTKKFVTEVLNKMEFNEENIQTVIRLIGAADRHASKRDDEAIIVDADSLSKLCTEHFKEKYTPESYQKVISLEEKEFPTRFKTEKGKQLYPKLLKKLKEEIL